METHRLLSIKDAAKYLGVNPETLRRWEKAGKLQPIRTAGNQRRYSVEMLESLSGANHERSNLSQEGSTFTRQDEERPHFVSEMQLSTLSPNLPPRGVGYFHPGVDSGGA